jgi:glycosyltransferase involved in cell wall biosynthesis
MENTATCVMGVVDEIQSLKTTIEILKNLSHEQIEIILVVAPFASGESRRICEFLAETSQVLMLEQVRPGIGGAYQDGFERATTELVVMMSSDLETDPNRVEEMLRTIRSDSNIDIVAVSRWLAADSFQGYSKKLKILNFCFQKLIKFTFRSSLTDFTYAFRVYRRSLLSNIEWEESRHSFFLESLIKPLANGAYCVEIPGRWVARREGVRHIKATDYFSYLLLVCKVKFRKKRGKKN